MWFAAKLLLESTGGDEGGRVLQEESIRLIQATNESDALSKATDLGRAEQRQYPNEQGEIVAWHFVSFIEIQDLCEDNVFDGLEVFSVLKWSVPAPAEVN